jgi:hypothetical protein
LKYAPTISTRTEKGAMDLVVMTCTQWERFVEMDSGFSRKVQEKGLLLI